MFTDFAKSVASKLGWTLQNRYGYECFNRKNSDGTEVSVWPMRHGNGSVLQAATWSGGVIEDAKTRRIYSDSTAGILSALCKEAK